MADSTTRETCRLCGSTELTRLLTLPPTPLANSLSTTAEESLAQERFDLFLAGCAGCGHVQLPVEVDPKRLFPSDYPYQSGTSAVFRAHLAELAGVISRATERRNALDIACNDGTLVHALEALGFWSVGIDPAAPVHQRMARAFFTEEWARQHRDDGNTYGVVTALNCYAHVPDMDDFTRGVKTLLEHDGLFIFEVGYLPDVVSRGLFETIYHEHLAYHSLSPLVPFFQKHGMALIDAHRIDSQGGSIRCFVRNCESHQTQSKRLRDLLDEESRSAIWEGVRDLNGPSIHSAVRGTRDALSALFKRHGKFAVYGAPAKLCTLVHATDAASWIDAVYDDNPLKVGRFVPGTAIPIRPVSELYERRPKAVYIASWNFADEIKARHAELGCEWAALFPRRKC